MKNQFSRRHFIKNATLTSAAVVASTHGLNTSNLCESPGKSKLEKTKKNKLNPLLLTDGLCKPEITIRPCQLLSTVCIKGGAKCPLMEEETAKRVLAKLKTDPTTTIRLETHVDEIPRFTALKESDFSSPDKNDVMNRKRDLDVLQRLGLIPGDTRRASYLYELLFTRIDTTRNICSYETKSWEGCKLAHSGSYEKVHAKGWQEIVYQRPTQECMEYRERNVERINKDSRLFVRPHHLMCVSCWYAGGKEKGLRSNDTLSEILERIRREPDIPVTLVEGTCMACDSCDGFYPPNGRCVHSCGLIRDLQKDLIVFQKMGLMPGSTLKGREAFALLFEKVLSTRDVCGYGDGIVRSQEWQICYSDPQGNPGYAQTRITGVF
jgi:hypothetical protein